MITIDTLFTHTSINVIIVDDNFDRIVYITVGK